MVEILWDTVAALVSAINTRNKTPDHSIRVADYAVQIAKANGWHQQTLNEIRLGALLHDIGQLTFPDYLIEKNAGAITKEEREIIEAHTNKGIEFIKPWPSLWFVTPYILHHQEWINGSGYPQGIKGDDYPKEVQVVSIADIYEAIRYPRHYQNRQGYSHIDTVSEMRKFRGVRWDAEIFDVFEQISSYFH